MRLWRFIVVSLFLLPQLAAAVVYDDSALPYSDPPRDLPTRIAVSVLTQEGIVRGNPDGTFRPNTLLNRAEYVKIVMGLVDISDVSFHLGCFPDIADGVWYEVPVCAAKAMSIVRGNAVEGVPADRWLFEPERPVQYEEAVKILVGVFDLPVVDAPGEWYESYLETAKRFGIELPGLQPGHPLTRGEMSRLTANFIAYDRAELSDLKAAQRGEVVSSRSSSSSSVSSRSSAASHSTGSGSSSSVPPVTMDPDSNVDTRPQFIVLGSVSPVLGAASVQMEAEPLQVGDILITLQDPASSISFFRVYDENAALLGTAYLDTASGNGTVYRLNMPRGALELGKQEDFSFYVRAVAKSHDGGGVSGEDVQIDYLTVEGDGSWSNRSYSQSTSETFPIFQTARATFTEIKNAGPTNDVLVAGPGQLLGTYRFSGDKGDSAADLLIQQLMFNIERTGGTTLSNVKLATDAGGDQHDCSVSSSTVTCSSIPPGFGEVEEDTPRVLRLYGDVSVPNGTLSASLRLSLNEAGNVNAAGAVSWSDGDTVFQWVPFETPVARGTYFSF